MNVILTCAGRRNYLVKFFQEALGNRGQVFATDSNLEAPALQEADEYFLLPPIHHSDYFDNLLDICQQKQVRLLIPLNDLELPYLAEQRDRFLTIGTIPVVSSPEVINICFDKFATFQFLENIGLSSPKTYLSVRAVQEAIQQGEITFPLVVKPRWGSASIGIEYPEDDEELELAYRYVQKKICRTILADVSACDIENCILIQERVLGEEYGLDIINNLDGEYVTTFVKRKLGMRAGETDRAVTVAEQKLQNIGQEIARKLSHIGNLDCDVIVNSRGCYVLEMNPRFGGGYPFSHCAGANLPAMLIAWANGVEPEPSWQMFAANVISSKCDRLIVHQQ
ncbi:MAG: ATP-grasp domain-containing protein [Aulosira sp. ZfuVER01]|nr:ATP-grasp domain-containing protein [Aulosira sp. ZfuVER01]MDZ7998048.1 ATP-grasp domain-containing protein [Aulosira sp. DedVER01a]MDZ8050442.1 ATP-grasp domain-containing protein [Aulosira sp. ZfuCHP01]